MKTSILLVCVVAAIAHANAGALRVRRQLVPREFQNINIENYLKNERAVAFQLKCIVYDGPCDRIGKYLKITIPELLTNQCRNCDPEQRMRAGRLVAHIQQNFPKEWEDAVKKFQGGQVKPEDAHKLETLLGVKLDPKLVGATAEPVPEASSSTTAAPTSPSTEKAVEVPSTTTAAVTTTTTTTTVAPPSTAASETVSSTTAAATTAAASETKSEVVEAAAADAVPAAVAAPTTSEAPASSSSSVAPPTSSEAPAAPASSEAPKVTEAPSTAAPEVKA